MSSVAVPVIAIDGPSASGKGTVAQRVAASVGFHYLDSGALYRLVALSAERAGIPLTDETGLARLADGLPAIFQGEKILLENKEVTDDIRTAAIGVAASVVAALPPVRTALLARQRAFRQPPGLVADGRDIGSVIFPDAVLKVFLTASPEVRAERRYKQLMDKGMNANLAALLQELRQRDARDAGRAVAPLLKGADAVELDTTSLSVDAVVSKVLAQYQRVSSDSPRR
ncbi:MAG: (d)CMP kinase [Burkholderiales bacterium]